MLTGFDRAASHPLLRELKQRDAPGLVLFSSGSTGESKASVLDFDRLLAKFEVPRPAYRTLVFLLLDHIGGINTLLHGALSRRDHRHDPRAQSRRGMRRDRSAPDPAAADDTDVPADAADRRRHPALRSLLARDRHLRHGTDAPDHLAAVREALPWVKFKQTYGLSELGILPTRSREFRLGLAQTRHRV